MLPRGHDVGRTFFGLLAAQKFHSRTNPWDIGGTSVVQYHSGVAVASDCFEVFLGKVKLG